MPSKEESSEKEIDLNENHEQTTLNQNEKKDDIPNSIENNDKSCDQSTIECKLQTLIN